MNTIKVYIKKPVKVNMALKQRMQLPRCCSFDSALYPCLKDKQRTIRTIKCQYFYYFYSNFT